MTMTDSIADLLTRIRNANMVSLPTTIIPFSKTKEAIVKLLKDEGYIVNYEVLGENEKKNIVVTLKYMDDGTKVISGLKRISKPGCRVYSKCEDIAPVRRGMGVAVVSTSKGILTDSQARQNRLGGEVICHVW